MAIVCEHFEKGSEYFNQFYSRMFTVSTGALALSITFKTSLTKGSPDHLWLLSWAWVWLTTSILSHLVDRFAMGLYFFGLSTEKNMEAEIHMKISSVATLVSFLTFSAGVFSLGSFAVLNNI